MNLLFLEKNKTTFNKNLKLIASLSRKGVVNLSKKCTNEFDLNSRFLYGRIAINPTDNDFKNLTTFYFVEETNKKLFETDQSLIKLTIGHTQTGRFCFSELYKKFKNRFTEESIKSIAFKVTNERINGHNVLTFNLINQ